MITEPTARNDRYVVMGVLRGFALFGTLPTLGAGLLLFGKPVIGWLFKIAGISGPLIEMTTTHPQNYSPPGGGTVR